MAEHYYTVGVHGAPTPETAPHGFAWQSGTRKWWNSYSYVDGGGMGADAKWFPLPAPPTEQAPPPEPVARWTSHYDNRGMWVLLCERSPNFTKDEAAHILKTLNTLDRDGVAWGPGRPMSELPDGHEERVIVKYGAPNDYRFAKGTTRGEDMKNGRLCWWPLPSPRGGP